MKKFSKEDYKHKTLMLAEKHKEEVFQLKKKYAMANSSVQVGDMVTDHMGSVKVERIKIHTGYHVDDLPSCVYYGPCYTKSGRPFKSGERRGAYQANLVEENNNG